MKRTISVLLAILLMMSVVFCSVTAVSAENKGPAISVQPQDVSVNYPDSAEFTVVPENPAAVASYQWYYVDQMGQVFKLDGSSAKTATLVCPSTHKDYDGQYFYCELADSSGNVTTSDPAYVEIKNYSENKKMLYVGDYTVERGKTLDLSTTTLGSGTVSYAEDGKSMTLNNVQFDSTNMIFDHIVSASLCFTIDDSNTEIERFDVNLVGDNCIKNTFYQEARNESGISLDLFFTGVPKSGKAPDVHIGGSGKLNIIGGTIELRTNGDLYLEAPISFNAYGEYFSDAVNGKKVTVGENVPLDFDVNGTLIYAKNSIDINKGAVIKAKTSAPYVMGEYTHKNGFLCTNDINITNAKVDIELTADPNRFIPNGTAVESFLGMNNNGAVNITDNSEVKIKESCIKGREPYFSHGGGISCGELNVSDSVLDINVNSDDIFDSYGINASDNITVTDSTLNCFEHTSGRVFGIAANGDFIVKDSTVVSDCNSADEKAYGIMYKTTNIDLNLDGNKVDATVNDGFAMGANIGKGREIKGFDKDYEVVATTLGENTIFETPLDAVINQASMEQSTPGSYIYLETPYSPDNTEKTPNHIVIKSNIVEPTTEETTEEPSEIPTEKETAKPASPSDAPTTGDNTNFGLWIVLLAVSTVALLSVTVRRKKTQDK